MTQKIIWHPFTQEKIAAPPIEMESGKGSYLYDKNGKEYLDLISSWWVNLHGHSRPEIADAIYKQAKTLEHVIFAGITHKPATTLCEKLQTILPKDLSKFFYSDNGSTSVEVALKMAYQYWQNKEKEDKTLFLNFQGGYHGDTVGAMSLGDEAGYHSIFSKLLFPVLTVPFPATWEGDENVEEKENKALEVLKSHLDESADKIAAFILEPLMQGASGMRFCRHSFLNKALKLVREYGVLIIFDEVMTGFGRTGTYFALDQLEIVPDFICVSKGITGGFMPLALTITTEKIYDAFLGDSIDKAFPHGHSYTANPLGCAAGIASFDLLTSKETQESIKNINLTHKRCIENLDRNIIKNVRILGTISAFDLLKSGTFSELQKLRNAFLEKGLIVRPIGQTVYILPPYSTTTAALESSYKKIEEVLKAQ